jgi:ABC-2 type transport system ATP-binding protein
MKDEEEFVRCKGVVKSFRVPVRASEDTAKRFGIFPKKSYVTKFALKGVDFSVRKGEIVGLIGANGAGKTTLMKILTGIISANEGAISVLGHNPWRREHAFKKKVALVMGQKSQLWWDLPALDCFALLREIFQVDRVIFKETLDELVAVLGVESLLTVQIRRLSLGERMKMELIASLLHRPKVLFLDEPTIGLDLTSQKAVRKFLLAYQQKHETGMVVTSHYMEDIKSLCERLVILRQGETVFEGDTKAIIQKYLSHKLVSATVPSASSSIPSLPHGVEVLPDEDDRIRLKVHRDEVSKILHCLIQQGEVADIKVEDEDISDIIERLMVAA